MEKIILFQGDSITDAERDRASIDDLGKGYANLVAAEIGYEKPCQFTFINKGISGNRITDLIARYKQDFINLKPDYLSILIGINDVWHEISFNNGVDTDKYELFYDMLIKDIKKELPNTNIMILEPFVLKGSETEKDWERFRHDAEEKAAVAKKIAEKNNLVFIPLMEKFDEAAKTAPEIYWTKDGVHPTPMGHEIIKREWIKGFNLLNK